MLDINFYQNHLNKVSRSFAFCIETLETPLRRWVSSSYLICRLLDTIEDAQWNNFNQQTQQFKKFNDLLDGRIKDVETWCDSFPANIPESEKHLVADAGKIFNDFREFPDKVQVSIRSLVSTMSYGMSKYQVSRGLQLKTMPELNRYCFYVAGVVGELLTKLVSYIDPSFSPDKQVYKNAYHFGLFLQKVNLLKDQREDEKLGRYFIFDRGKVEASLKHHAEGGFAYINSIPVEQKSYRLFCAWSLFIGLASFPWMVKSYNQNKVLKIPRVKTLFIIHKLESLISQPKELRLYFEKLLKPLQAEVKLDSSMGQSKKFDDAHYKGELSLNELKSVGIIL